MSSNRTVTNTWVRRRLTFYTDGVTEAENAAGDFYTGGRLQRVLERLPKCL